MYTLNMSRSKPRLDVLIKQDSSNGYRIPRRPEIERDLLKAKELLQRQPGIANVSVISDWNQYIFKVKCDFEAIEKLDKAIENLATLFPRRQQAMQHLHDNYNATGNAFTRSSYYDATKTAARLSAIEKNILNQSNYTCIYRFSKPVSHCSNVGAQVSKDSRSVMLRQNMLQLATGEKSINNTIYLQK